MELKNIFENRHSQRIMRKNQSISKEDMDYIAFAINSSATSMGRHSASTIFITDQDLKKKIFSKNELPSQAHIADSALLAIFCIDQNRATISGKLTNKEVEYDTLEDFLQGYGDAYIQATNASIAARNLGYETVYLGGMRFFQIPELIQEEFNLPETVVPVLGMSIGKVDKINKNHSRRLNKVYFNNYDAKVVEKEMIDYDKDEVEFLGKDNPRGFDFLNYNASTYTRGKALTQGIKKSFSKILDLTK
ncbi:nitroreductase [Mycoplasma testudineum]|uniref:Nitroreductase n=1 Tax=Mycoplasma testudineum TaxID=244584 RepID=A0A4R6IHA7_9MOLU|nr:nitroreductase family protein [Mycoplasma testudineum]OYD26886.1 nitroreductase [Mycoplasma testudineum]TDO20435.1 nitroreductase [Mycoplasma testudineum]